MANFNRFSVVNVPQSVSGWEETLKREGWTVLYRNDAERKFFGGNPSPKRIFFDNETKEALVEFSF